MFCFWETILDHYFAAAEKSDFSSIQLCLLPGTDLVNGEFHMFSYQGSDLRAREKRTVLTHTLFKNLVSALDVKELRAGEITFISLHNEATP